MPKIDCNGYLGFEIIENDVVIRFTTDLYYIDKKKSRRIQSYRYIIAAYDRLLNYKESSYKNLWNNNMHSKNIS